MSFSTLFLKQKPYLLFCSKNGLLIRFCLSQWVFFRRDWFFIKVELEKSCCVVIVQNSFRTYQRSQCAQIFFHQINMIPIFFKVELSLSEWWTYAYYGVRTSFESINPKWDDGKKTVLLQIEMEIFIYFIFLSYFRFDRNKKQTIGMIFLLLFTFNKCLMLILSKQTVKQCKAIHYFLLFLGQRYSQWVLEVCKFVRWIRNTYAV